MNMNPQLKQFLAFAMLAITIATPLANGLLVLAERAEEAAKLTPTKKDDVPARNFVLTMRKVVAGLARVAAFFPRLTFGARRGS